MELSMSLPKQPSVLCRCWFVPCLRGETATGLHPHPNGPIRTTVLSIILSLIQLLTFIPCAAPHNLTDCTIHDFSTTCEICGQVFYSTFAHARQELIRRCVAHCGRPVGDSSGVWTEGQTWPRSVYIFSAYPFFAPCLDVFSKHFNDFHDFG